MIGSTGARDRPPYPVVETPSHPIVGGSVPRTCIAAGAVVVERDGHAEAASYGSVPGEIAVCMKAVGLADRSDLGVRELRGDQNPLDRALAYALGDPPLAVGTARRMRGVWYVRLEARRALLIGLHAELASVPAIGRGRDRSELQQREIGSGLAIVSVIGPRAARLLAAAQLPGELAIGAAGRDASDASVVAVLRESGRRFLVLVRRPAADALWARLLHAGEPLGAAFVGRDALTLLGASSASGV